LRQTVLIVAASAVLLAAGGIALRSLLRSQARSAEVERLVEHARELARSEQGLSSAAIELQRALALDPDSVPALIERGEVCLRLARLDESIAHLRHAVVVAERTGADGRARAQLVLARSLMQRYRGSSAEEDFRGAHNAFLAAQHDPAWSAEALEGRATLFLEKGRNRNVEKALALFDEFLRLHSGHPLEPGIREFVDQLRGRSAADGG